MLQLRPAVGHRQDVLRARLGPPHRPAHGAGVPPEGKLFGIGARLGAEATTDVWDDHPHLARVEPVDLGEQVLRRVGALARRVVNESTLIGPVRRPGTALDRRRGHPLVDDSLGDDDLASAEVGLLRRGEPHHHVRAVLGKEQHLVVDRGFGIDNAVERLVVDHHEIGGIGPSRPVLGDDRDDGLTDVAHRAHGDERTAHRVGECGIDVGGESELGEVVGGEHGQHSGRSLRRSRVDAENPGVGVGGSDVREPGRIWEFDVLDVRPPDCQQPGIFETHDPGAEDAPHRCDHRFRA